jgi:hypothetical protein
VIRQAKPNAKGIAASGPMADVLDRGIQGRLAEESLAVTWNWLRVLDRLAASRRVQRGGYPLHTRGCGQQHVWHPVVDHETGIRVIAAFFGPHAPYALMAHASVFSHDLKG